MLAITWPIVSIDLLRYITKIYVFTTIPYVHQIIIVSDFNNDLSNDHGTNIFNFLWTFRRQDTIGRSCISHKCK